MFAAPDGFETVAHATHAVAVRLALGAVAEAQIRDVVTGGEAPEHMPGAKLAALEELRMLSNLETEKSKLQQIVLVGQRDLRGTLASPELEQLRQRITVSHHLEPLDQDEASNDINHRLRRAALGTGARDPAGVPTGGHRRCPCPQPGCAAHDQRHM